MIEINEKLAIDKAEISFRFARSGGPGGQNVNKLSTKVILYFDVANSPSLDDSQKRILMEKLVTRISKEGVLRVMCRRHRTQKANRDEALNRFTEIIRKALTRKPKRIKTGIPSAAVKKRLEEKKKQGRKKERRRKDISWD